VTKRVHLTWFQQLDDTVFGRRIFLRDALTVTDRWHDPSNKGEFTMLETANYITRATIVLGGAILLAGCVTTTVRPSAMVSMAEIAAPGATTDMRTGTPEGTGGGVYRVPDGKVLVITRVIIQPMSPGAGIVDIAFIQSDAALGDRLRQTWRVPRSQPTEYDFTPGYLISAGSTLKIRNNGSSGGEVAVLIYGYITTRD